MKYVHSVPRWALGLIYFVFGLNGFLMAIGKTPFIPMPPPETQPPAAAAFGAAMFATGYFFSFLKVTEVVFGFLLLINKFSPLALVVLAPVTINIFLFHYFLSPSELLMPIVMIVVHLFLGFQYRKSFKPLFQ